MTILENGAWNGDYSHAFDEQLAVGISDFLESSNVNTVFDFGCGLGTYSKHLINAGFDCDASDGSPNVKEQSDGIAYQLDLSKPFKKEKRDAVLCLEVGEHIPVQYEQIVLDNITKHGNIIILSWAIEGQPGDGHINCRNNDYIIQQVEKRGFKYNEDESIKLREKSTISWFKNTVMVFNSL